MVYTDHSACLSLLNTPRPSGKLARWAMMVQEMNLTLKHRSGRQNANADALSCNPLSEGAKNVGSVSSGEVMLGCGCDNVCSVGIVKPVAVGDSTPMAVGDSTPVAVGDSTPVAVGDSTPVVVGDSTPVAGDNSTPVAVGDSTPVVFGDSTPVADDDSTPVAVGDSTPVAVGDCCW